MNYETIFFYFFSSIVLISAIFVIYSTNTIYSVFFLILCFISATCLLLISQVEFISIMLTIIYVGAITVLFLFVIMMLDINTVIDKSLKPNYGYLPIIFLFGFIFFIETFTIFSKIVTSYQHRTDQTFFTGDNTTYPIEVLPEQMDDVTNIETLGQVLYGYYSFFFLIAGIVLLIALIGAVTLTKKKLKKKKITTKAFKQLSRNSSHAVFNVKSGSSKF